MLALGGDVAMASARNLQRGVLGVPELQDAAGADVLDAVVLDAPLVEQRCGRVKVGPSVDREADVIEPDPVRVEGVRADGTQS